MFEVTPPVSARRAADIAAEFDLRHLPADFLANPYPVYAALRRTEPVRRMPDGSYFLTRHADLMAVYRDAATFSSDKRVEFAPKYGTDSHLYAHHTSSLVFNDPPLHTRVRKLIMGALTRRAIAEMEPGLTARVDDLLDRLEARGGGDLIEDFAAAIPVDVIGNLLGVPQADREPLRGWSLAILGALEPVLTPQQAEWGNRSVHDMLDYLRGLVADSAMPSSSRLKAASTMPSRQASSPWLAAVGAASRASVAVARAGFCSAFSTRSSSASTR